MSKLIELLDNITEFGENPNVNVEDKEREICKLLASLYSEYLSMSLPELDDKNYDEDPNFNSDLIRKNIEKNFPNFGWYHCLTNSHKLLEEAELGTGDAIDDLSDIVKDMLDVKWIINNHSLANGLWQFHFWMKYHCEQHLVDFLKYAKDQKG